MEDGGSCLQGEGEYCAVRWGQGCLGTRCLRCRAAERLRGCVTGCRHELKSCSALELKAPPTWGGTFGLGGPRRSDGMLATSLCYVLPAAGAGASYPR